MAYDFGWKVRSVVSFVRHHFGGLIVVAVVLTAFVLGFTLRGGGQSETGDADAQAAQAPQRGQAATQYTCSMHPEVRMPNPDDKCPICLMALIPVSSSLSGSSGLSPNEISLSPQAAALIDVQTTPVTRRLIQHRVNMVGTVDYDETRLAYITAYVNGRLDRMFVDYTGITVQQGDHLAEIYSPDLLVAQQELIQARRSLDRPGSTRSELASETSASLLASARERLRLLGLTPEQIEAAETQGVTDDHITLYAPIGGVVIEKHAKPGSYVKEGDRIYTIADLDQVWVILEAYESDLPWLRYGQRVEFTAQAFGEETFAGQIAFIDPLLDRRKRTVRVRVNVDNSDGRLRPGMFVRAVVLSEIADAGRVIAPELAGKWISPMHPEVVRDEPGDCPVCGMDLVRAEDMGYAVASGVATEAPLVIPDTAVLRTGKRGVVYVRIQEEPEPRFEGRVVELGPRGEGFFIVRSGLKEGERVVTRGNFQIDSALQIQAGQSMMNPPSPDDPDPGAATQPPPRVHLHGPAAAPFKNLFNAYLALSNGLADDDAKTASDAVRTVQSTIEDIPTTGLPDPFAEVWSEHRQQIEDAAQRLGDAQDIELMRSAFQPLSDALIKLLESTHIEGIGELHRAHCPMAFDFTGASWLTDKPEIANPYFGDRMLRCGTIEETLATPPVSTTEQTNPSQQNGGHNHE